MRDSYEILDSAMERILRYHPKAKAKLMPIYPKYRTPMMYGIFGFQTFLVSIITYAIFTEVWHWDVVIANAVSWVFATAFAFITNRLWVFTNCARGWRAFFKQLGSFSAGRIFTLLIEEFMLWFFIGELNLPNMPVKFVAQFVVIATNYFVSNLIVFRSKGRTERMIREYEESGADESMKI